jgi:predicted TIM-barrel fold metal-dependent hydrolase
VSVTSAPSYVAWTCRDVGPTMAGTDLDEAIGMLPFFDHHAHLLAHPTAGYSLAEVLTEAPDTVPQSTHHLTWLRAQRDLAEGLATARDLLDECRFEAMLVDDGYQFPGAMTIAEHAATVGCPVERVLRIETTAEDAAADWPAWAGVRERFRESVTAGLAAGAAALKTIAAYRSGLDLPPPDDGEAASAYRHWRRIGGRLEAPELVSWFLAEALDVLRTDPRPLQVHTGIGDADLALHRADPALLGGLLRDPRNGAIPVVALHCYPFVRQASWLASVHANAFVDLSLALMLAPHRGADLVLDALDLAPVSKVLVATDAMKLPEAFFLAARWCRDAVSGAVGRLVAAGVLDEATALDWARMLLGGNARRIYRDRS